MGHEIQNTYTKQKAPYDSDKTSVDIRQPHTETHQTARTDMKTQHKSNLRQTQTDPNKNHLGFNIDMRMDRKKTNMKNIQNLETPSRHTMVRSNNIFTNLNYTP